MDEAVCVLLRASDLRKGMNPSVLFLAILNCRADWFLILVRQSKRRKTSFATLKN